ncbi:MAG: hypothetical protein R2875_11640, partial [Desulfobacterales bacterium]
MSPDLPFIRFSDPLRPISIKFSKNLSAITTDINWYFTRNWPLSSEKTGAATPLLQAHTTVDRVYPISGRKPETRLFKI